MKLTAIKESGANNTLMWALANNVNPKTDEQLTSVINDEMFYLVNLSGINFLELLRLSQIYREKLRIISEYPAEIPERSELATSFNGSYTPDPQAPERKAPLYEVVENALSQFMNLATQMGTDNDIISMNAQRLFIPMLCRKFDVQLPLSFYDFVEFMTEDESKRIFAAGEYPNSLSIVVDESNNVKTRFLLSLIKTTGIIRYNKRYDQYIRLIKYAPLANPKNDTSKLYKFGLIGFYKYDNVSRGEVRCSLSPAPPSKEQFANILKRLAFLSTPLNIEFAVQLPIQYMQVIANSMPADVLGISYSSSMSTIIDDGLSYDDFVTPEIDPNTEDPTEQEKIKKFDNEVTAYKIRIAEANETLMKSLPIILDANADGDIDITGTFAMLPAIYKAKAVFTLDVSKSSDYVNHYDPLVAEMFRGMLDMADKILNDITRNK